MKPVILTGFILQSTGEHLDQCSLPPGLRFSGWASRLERKQIPVMKNLTVKMLIPILGALLSGCGHPEDDAKIAYEGSVFVMGNPKIGYECVLNLEAGGKWTMEEKESGKVIEIQSGDYHEDKSAYRKTLNFGKIHLHVDWLKPLEETTVGGTSGNFADPSMYFADENTLVLYAPGSYVFKRKPTGSPGK